MLTTKEKSQWLNSVAPSPCYNLQTLNQLIVERFLCSKPCLYVILSANLSLKFNSPPSNVATPPSDMVFENVSFLLKALYRVSSCHFFIVDCFESSGSRLGDLVQLSTDAQLCNV